MKASFGKAVITGICSLGLMALTAAAEEPLTVGNLTVNGWTTISGLTTMNGGLIVPVGGIALGAGAQAAPGGFACSDGASISAASGQFVVNAAGGIFLDGSPIVGQDLILNPGRMVAGSGLSFDSIAADAYGAEQRGKLFKYCGYGTQSIGATAYGAEQRGYTYAGIQDIESSAHGAEQRGFNERGNQSIGASAYGAEQRGYVGTENYAINDGIGSIQLLNLNGYHVTAFMSGHASIGLGACTVTHNQSIVAGDGLVSHGNGTVTANGFYGNGSGLTGLNSLNFANGSIHGSKLESGTVGENQLGPDAILNTHIAPDASIAGSKLATGTITIDKVAIAGWENWADGRYMSLSGGQDLILNPGRTVAGYGLLLGNIAATAYGAEQRGLTEGGTQSIGDGAYGASQHGANYYSIQTIQTSTPGAEQRGVIEGGTQTIEYQAFGASQRGFNSYGTQIIRIGAMGAEQRGGTEGGTQIIESGAYGASQEGGAGEGSTQTIGLSAMGALQRGWNHQGTQTIGESSYGASQVGQNSGDQSIGELALGARQEGFNRGTESIGGSAFGAVQQGFLDFNATAINNGKGSIQLLSLSSDQQALMNGHASLGLGACTVAHDQAIVAGDDLQSQGNGTVTALGFYGSFHGSGAGLTDLPIDNISGLGTAARVNVTEFATAAQGTSAETALQVANTALQADGQVAWTANQDGGGFELNNLNNAFRLETSEVTHMIETEVFTGFDVYDDSAVGMVYAGSYSESEPGYYSGPAGCSIWWDDFHQGWQLHCIVDLYSTEQDNVNTYGNPFEYDWNGDWFCSMYNANSLFYYFGDEYGNGTIEVSSPSPFEGYYSGEIASGYGNGENYFYYMEGYLYFYHTYVYETREYDIFLGGSLDTPPSGVSFPDTYGYDGFTFTIHANYQTQEVPVTETVTTPIAYELANGRNPWVGEHDANGNDLINVRTLEVTGTISGNGSGLREIGSDAIVNGSITYLDLDAASIGAHYVKKSGDTINGDLDIQGTLTVNGQPISATLNYIQPRGDLSMGPFTSTGSDPFTQGLLAHYVFENDAADMSGNGNDGTIFGDPDYYATGGHPNGVYFLGGSDDFITAPPLAGLNANALTVSAWIKPTEPLSTYAAVVKQTGETDSGQGFSIEFDGYNVRFWIHTDGPNGGWRSGPAAVVQFGQWNHVVGVYDGALIRLYVNGLEVATATPAQGGMTMPDGLLGIGKDLLNTGRLFHGWIDSVRIYARALPAAEIGSLFNGGF